MDLQDQYFHKLHQIICRVDVVVGKCKVPIVGACLYKEGKEVVVPGSLWTREKWREAKSPKVGEGGEANTVVSGRSV